MSAYTQEIIGIEHQYNQVEQIRKRIDFLVRQIGIMNDNYVVMLEAQQLLASVSDANTSAVLDYITGIINKTLGELFPYDTRRIFLERSLYRGQHAHITIKLSTENGKTRDMTLQSGTGLRQVISFLFVLCLIEVRKGRRLLIADELLNGLHPEAKRVVMDVLRIFAEDGFQIVMIEYGVDNVGKLYLVEKPNEVATVAPLDGDTYNNEIFVFNRPPEEVDLNEKVEEVGEFE